MNNPSNMAKELSADQEREFFKQLFEHDTDKIIEMLKERNKRKKELIDKLHKSIRRPRNEKAY